MTALKLSATHHFHPTVWHSTFQHEKEATKTKMAKKIMTPSRFLTWTCTQCERWTKEAEGHVFQLEIGADVLFYSVLFSAP